MNFSVLTVDEASRLSRAAMNHYSEVGEGMTFGEWILTTVYPRETVEQLRDLRDFCCAPRSNDARMYLLSMLGRGELDANILKQYLDTHALVCA